MLCIKLDCDLLDVFRLITLRLVPFSLKILPVQLRLAFEAFTEAEADVGVAADD